MLHLTPGYGGNPYPCTIPSGSLVAFMIGTTPHAVAANASIGLYWPQHNGFPVEAVDSAMLAIAYSAPTPRDIVRANIAGRANVAAALGQAAADGEVAHDVTLTHAIPAGATLWAVFDATYTGAAPTLVGAHVNDRCCVGFAMSAAGSIAAMGGTPQLIEFDVRPDLYPFQAAVTVP